MAPAGVALPLRSCRAVGRVSRTGVTRHRSPSSDYATLIRPTTTHRAWRGRQDCPHPALSQRARDKRMRQLLAPPHGACGRGCAPVPNSVWGRGLSERSEFRSPKIRDWGKGTRRATPGRQWFWVLLPKQKDLAVRGRNPTFRIAAPSAFPRGYVCSRTVARWIRGPGWKTRPGG